MTDCFPNFSRNVTDDFQTKPAHYSFMWIFDSQALLSVTANCLWQSFQKMKGDCLFLLLVSIRKMVITVINLP